MSAACNPSTLRDRVEDVRTATTLHFRPRRRNKDFDMPGKAPAPATSREIALDPNSTPEKLFVAMKDFPEEVLSNPSFELMMIERPNIWAEISELDSYSLSSVARLATVPPSLIEYAIHEGNNYLAHELVKNAQIDVKHRLALFSRSINALVPKEDWAATVGAHHAKLFERGGLGYGYYARRDPADDITRDEIEELAEIGILGLFLAIQHPFCPVEALDRARKLNSTEFESRALVARHPGVPVAWMEEFAVDPENYVRGAVARNPSAPPELLRKLAKDKERGVLLGVAENPSMTEDIAIALATKSPVAVRVAIAANNNVSLKVLKISAADKLEHVRKSLAGNKAAPAEICEILANDSSAGVRAKLATRTHVPPAILLKLTKDKDAQTARAAIKNSKTPKVAPGTSSAPKKPTSRLPAKAPKKTEKPALKTTKSTSKKPAKKTIQTTKNKTTTKKPTKKQPTKRK